MSLRNPKACTFCYRGFQSLRQRRRWSHQAQCPRGKSQNITNVTFIALTCCTRFVNSLLVFFFPCSGFNSPCTRSHEHNLFTWIKHENVNNSIFYTRTRTAEQTLMTLIQLLQQMLQIPGKQNWKNTDFFFFFLPTRHSAMHSVYSCDGFYNAVLRLSPFFILICFYDGSTSDHPMIQLTNDSNKGFIDLLYFISMRV